MARAIGLDLGSSTSSVAVFDGKQVKMLFLRPDERVTPTVVAHGIDKKIIVGRRAHATADTNPDFTYRGLKRLLGRRYNDPVVQEAQEHVTYELAMGPDGEAWVRGPDGPVSPEELLGHMIRHMKELAETALGERVAFAVVGVPANFDNVQKAAVRRACAFGGLECRRLVSEPTAAAIAYGMERGLGKTLAVYDLGGGTFDTTILKVSERRYRALATAGDPFLGGEDFDARIVDWGAEAFRARFGIDLRANRLTHERLRLEAEKAKVELSSADEFRMFLPTIAKSTTTHAVVDMDETISRETFEELVEDLIDRTRQPCLDVMRLAKVDRRQIDDVVLVGGMTRMPRVAQVVEELFGRAPVAGKLNPIEAVTMGCSIMAASIAGETKLMMLDDITASAFGVEASGGGFIPVIRRGASVPHSHTVTTANAEANVDAVAVPVYQGNAAVARDNRLLGVVALDGLMRRPAKACEIEITFDLDEDSTLSVTVTETATGRSITKGIHAETGLDDDDLERIRGLAEDEETGPLEEPEEVAPEEAPQADPLEEVAPESAPVASSPTADAESAGGSTLDNVSPPGDVQDDDLPPMPSATPRWAREPEPTA